MRTFREHFFGNQHFLLFPKWFLSFQKKNHFLSHIYFFNLDRFTILLFGKELTCLTLSQTSPVFYLSAVQVFWKHWEKEKLLVTSNFSFSQCLLPVWRTLCYFHQIWNCRLQTIPVWKSLKFVVWERIKIVCSILVHYRCRSNFLGWDAWPWIYIVC